jgi:hypothetical protein
MSRWQDDDPDEFEIEYEFDARLAREDRPATRTSYSEHPRNSIYSAGGLSGSWMSPLCPHPPQLVLASEAEGWHVDAGAGPDCVDSIRRFDLLLNLTGSSVFPGHAIPLPELSRWAGPSLIPEIVLDWPDMGIVHLSREFWVTLVGYLTQTKASMLVFCVGGHGRTGTAIACLMAACGWSSSDAIGWIRAHY